MKDMELQHRIENAIDTTLASLDPSVAQCDLLIENIKGGKKSVMGKRVPTIMKPRLSIGFVAAIAIMMIAMTALAIALLTPKEIVEQVAIREETIHMMNSLNCSKHWLRMESP